MRKIFSVLIMAFMAITAYTQEVQEVQEMDKEEVTQFDLPKYIVKISPLHLFGNHPFNRFPSFNIGLEQRLKDQNTSLYHEIGISTYTGGVNSNKLFEYFTADEVGEIWEEELISHTGFRLREQYRHYLKRGAKAFVFIGAEVFYNYGNSELGEWGWVNQNEPWGWGTYEKFYTYNRIKQEAGINPIFGFTYFSKNTTYSSKWNEFLHRLVMDLYIGLGVRFVSRVEHNVPADVDRWSGDNFFFTDGFFDEYEGNYFLPALTIGYKIGYIISK